MTKDLCAFANNMCSDMPSYPLSVIGVMSTMYGTCFEKSGLDKTAD